MAPSQRRCAPSAYTWPRAYRRQVVDRPAIPQVDMVVEVRLHIEEEPMVGNGDGGQCAGGTLFTSNHPSTAKLVRQSSLNSISHQRQVQLTLTPHCSLGSTIRIASGSGRQARLTGTDEVSEGRSALDGVSMLAPGISHWVVESHATICCRKRQHLQLEIIGLVLRHSGDQLSANRILQRLHVVPCRRHGGLDKRPTVPQAKDIGSVSDGSWSTSTHRVRVVVTPLFFGCRSDSLIFTGRDSIKSQLSRLLKLAVRVVRIFFWLSRELLQGPNIVRRQLPCQSNRDCRRIWTRPSRELGHARAY